jgi:hypothetical protein
MEAHLDWLPLLPVLLGLVNKLARIHRRAALEVEGDVMSVDRSYRLGKVSVRLAALRRIVLGEAVRHWTSDLLLVLSHMMDSAMVYMEVMRSRPWWSLLTHR